MYTNATRLVVQLFASDISKKFLYASVNTKGFNRLL